MNVMECNSDKQRMIHGKKNICRLVAAANTTYCLSETYLLQKNFLSHIKGNLLEGLLRTRSMDIPFFISFSLCSRESGLICTSAEDTLSLHAGFLKQVLRHFITENLCIYSLHPDFEHLDFPNLFQRYNLEN